MEFRRKMIGNPLPPTDSDDDFDDEPPPIFLPRSTSLTYHHNHFNNTNSSFFLPCNGKMLHKSRISAGANKRMKTRSWDNMHHEVLVEIMKRVTWPERIYVASYVSKSWLSAVLDSMSPPGVIDLRPLDFPEVEIGHPRFLYLISLMIDRKPPNSWSTLYLAENLLKQNKYMYIAIRTPMVFHSHLPESLENVLRLMGAVNDEIAAVVRDHCLLNLRHALSGALSMILDAHKSKNNLELLDVPNCNTICRYGANDTIRVLE